MQYVLIRCHWYFSQLWLVNDDTLIVTLGPDGRVVTISATHPAS